MKHPENDKLFSILVNHLPAAIILTNTPQTEIIYKNDVVSETCCAQLIKLFPAPETSNNILNERQLVKALLNGNIKNGNKLTATLEDGTQKWISIYTSPLIKGQKEIGLMAFFSDITDIIQQQKKLEQQNNSLNEFFKMIAHDLKTPFSGLYLYSDFLQDSVRTKDYESADVNVTLLKSCIQDALNTTNKLLEWALSNTGNIKPKYEKVHLHEFVLSVIEELRVVTCIKHLKIRTIIPKNLYATLDKNMIASAIRNLISNAIKFSHQGKTIEITVKKTCESILFSVRDYGIGMDEKQLDGFNLSGTVSRQNGTKGEFGNGIGLSISRNFIDIHGGKLWAESMLGEGSNFIFTIPYHDTKSISE